MPNAIEQGPGMSTRIQDRLETLRRERRKALVIFVTAGFPERDSTPGVVSALEDAGADIIELGMPFSDPLADGSVIQSSSAKALDNGMTLKGILESVKEIRKGSSVPIVLMGYLNPIMSYGQEAFFHEAAEAGVDGMILPELPLEEAPRLAREFEKNGIAQILLVTPTTPDDRMKAIDEASSGFVYCVSSTGVTGSGKSEGLVEYIHRARAAITRNPLLVGFGIKSVEDARAAGAGADGVIIGSAFLKRLQDGMTVEDAAGWVREIRRGLDRS
jgi:tryptophan synthase alpha chain